MFIRSNGKAPGPGSGRSGQSRPRHTRPSETCSPQRGARAARGRVSTHFPRESWSERAPGWRTPKARRLRRRTAGSFRGRPLRPAFPSPRSAPSGTAFGSRASLAWSPPSTPSSEPPCGPHPPRAWRRLVQLPRGSQSGKLLPPSPCPTSGLPAVLGASSGLGPGAQRPRGLAPRRPAASSPASPPSAPPARPELRGATLPVCVCLSASLSPPRAPNASFCPGFARTTRSA